jgi:thiamine biosynthesis lipoprotein
MADQDPRGLKLLRTTTSAGAAACLAAPPEQRLMIERRFEAMGTEVVVRSFAPHAVEDVRFLFDEVEQRCSRFRPDSELSTVNGDTRPAVRVSPELRSVLEWAERARNLTGGLVEAGLGARLLDLGYDRTFVEMPDPLAYPPDRSRPRWELRGTILHRRPGVAIDLGGIAKGWAADLAIECTAAETVNAGGDIRSRQPATVVEVLDPWHQPVARVALGAGGLATSSQTRRRWRAGSRVVHHLIDPRTGHPASSPVLSATALAATAVEAEIAAKAILLLGADGLAWAAAMDWVRDALVVWEDGSVFATAGLEVAA